MRPDVSSLHEVWCLRRAIRRFDATAERVAREEGVGWRSYLLLLAIEGVGGKSGRLTVNDIAEELGLESHSVSGAVARAESQGFVRRERCDEDARRIWVSLTDEGQRVVLRIASQLEHDRAQLVREVVNCSPRLAQQAMEEHS